MKSKVRIASGQGFWGDLLTAPIDQVTKGPIDYLVMDYLAEVTMSIMQKQKQKDPKLGYAKDLIPLMEQILPACVEKNIKVITNGGGVNPIACSEAILTVAQKLGIKGLKVGVVLGDDILEKLDDLTRAGADFRNLDTGEPLQNVRSRVSSANVYFGAWPIVDALKKGAQIVITGRTTDTGITLAPMIFEFGWKHDDWDKLAAGTIAGHILECGGQSSGGNFSADWRAVPDMAHIGFPIAEAYPDGSIVITKHENTGGMVTLQTVKEQLLYEIGNPREYITPDCIADFTTINLAQDGKDRVQMTGVKGRPATEFYKVSMSYFDGYTAFGTLTYSWPEALEKAKKADEVLRTRLADLHMQFEEIRTEFLGYNSCHGPLSPHVADLNEVVLRIGVRSQDYKSVERFGKEIAPLILTGPPGVTGFAGGRPKPSEVISYWPALIPKRLVNPEIVIKEI
ncbi:MAG TPA: acyclic terpene utilization AtuA family protein [Bacteroidota bacterium]|nr:acyclic terpene utilization AtuA family protein [Bacteroidota bacterium]